MSVHKNSVSLHPYFTVHEGQMDQVGSFVERFIAATKAEKKCLYYNFTIRENVVFCREAYVDAEAVLTHLGNVGAIIEEFLKVSDLTRCEVHGPEAELEKLKGPMADLNCEWFPLAAGVDK